MSWNKDEDGSIYVFPVQQADGNWVKWEDYAQLKAQVERLTKCITVNPAKVEGMELKMQILRRDSAYLILDQAKETERLNAKIERLTKAGDAVCESPYLWETDPAVIEWRAAKEGKHQP
jgi:hypothetical protein